MKVSIENCVLAVANSHFSRHSIFLNVLFDLHILAMFSNDKFSANLELCASQKRKQNPTSQWVRRRKLVLREV